MDQILIVDDEAGIRSTLAEILADEGYGTTVASNIEETRQKLQRGFYDLAILDIWLPDGDGLDLLTEMRRDHAETPVLMISGHASIDTAVKALHLGAYDFLEKPLSSDKVSVTLRNAARQLELERENETLRETAGVGRTLVGRWARTTIASTKGIRRAVNASARGASWASLTRPRVPATLHLRPSWA